MEKVILTYGDNKKLVFTTEHRKEINGYVTKFIISNTHREHISITLEISTTLPIIANRLLNLAGVRAGIEIQPINISHVVDILSCDVTFWKEHIIYAVRLEMDVRI